LNPEARRSNELPANDLDKAPPLPTAFWECAKGNDCHCLTSIGCPEDLLKAWPHLPPHIKETIHTIVDAALSRVQGA
jgi:hypothetical protein